MADTDAYSQALARWREIREDYAEIDLSPCPYFQGGGRGGEGQTCTFGCWEEPNCVASRPSEGWPGEWPWWQRLRWRVSDLAFSARVWLAETRDALNGPTEGGGRG